MTIGRFPKSKLSLPKPNIARFRQIAKVQHNLPLVTHRGLAKLNRIWGSQEQRAVNGTCCIIRQMRLEGRIGASDL
jgi:hypothetical protein